MSAIDAPEPDESADGFTTAINYPTPFNRYAVRLCQTASRYLNILSPALDHAVFDHEALADAIGALVRRSQQTQVRILVSDSRAVVVRGHRLLTLARRLPSKVQLQKLAEHPDWNNETIVIRDRNGVLYKPGGSDHDAFYEPDSRASTQRHLDRFNELWRLSAKDAELRSLTL